MILKPSDLLYNTKSCFPIENKLISMGEQNLKESIIQNIKQHGIF